MATARSSSRRNKPKRRARNLPKLVQLAAASLSAGHDAMLSAKRAAECVDSLNRLSRAAYATSGDDNCDDSMFELALAAMRAPGAESGYAIATRALGTLHALQSDFGGGADPINFVRTLPAGVYYSPYGNGLPYQARVWNGQTKEAVSLGRYATAEEAAKVVAKYKEQHSA